jgi:hypothetical protein
MAKRKKACSQFGRPHNAPGTCPRARRVCRFMEDTDRAESAQRANRLFSTCLIARPRGEILAHREKSAGNPFAGEILRR